MRKQERKYIDREQMGKGETKSLSDQRKIIGNNLNFASLEAYKLLRTNLIFSTCDEKNCKIIGVTSALRGEGKSTTAINLAYVLAEAKKKTLLIEGDMRLPRIQSLLQFHDTPGLSNVLAGVNTFDEAIHSNVFANTLSILPSGEIPPNPSELISSERMRVLLSTLSDSYDYIIIDLPPITAVSDGLAISTLLSGMLVVVRPNYCDHRSLADVMRQMEFLNVKTLGFVVNCRE